MTSPEPFEVGLEENCVSLVRIGDDADQLRKRLERPARLGRYVLGVPGVVTAAAGIALWLIDHSIVGIAFAAFGGVLIVLGVAQHILLRRELAHWPMDALLFDEGIELTLTNGEVRGVMWSDPQLSIVLVNRRAPAPAGREFLLVWMMDSRIPLIELSAEGFDRLMRVAATQRLDVNERRRGHGDKAARWIEIRPGVLAGIPHSGDLSAATSPP